MSIEASISLWVQWIIGWAVYWAAVMAGDAAARMQSLYC
jgi:hypothetical protein